MYCRLDVRLSKVTVAGTGRVRADSNTQPFRQSAGLRSCRGESSGAGEAVNTDAAVTVKLCTWPSVAAVQASCGMLPRPAMR